MSDIVKLIPILFGVIVKIQFKDDLFVDFKRPSQQFLSHVSTIARLPVLNQYLADLLNDTTQCTQRVSNQGHFILKPSTLPLSHRAHRIQK